MLEGSSITEFEILILVTVDFALDLDGRRDLIKFQIFCCAASVCFALVASVWIASV